MTVFGQRMALNLYFRGNQIAILRPDGTAAAAVETINCNCQFTGMSDPRPVSSDPFRRYWRTMAALPNGPKWATGGSA
jgi:hypothetical protein